MRIHSVRVKNFKTLQDVHMRDIPNFAVLIGANGTGKTTFVDVFGFLKDCLTHNVRTAVATGKRAGFSQLVSRGHEKEAIEIELKVELELEGSKRRKVTYLVEIAEQSGRAIVRREQLRWTRGAGGKPFNFIDFENGHGVAVQDRPDVAEKDLQREDQTLDSPDILALKGLGQFKRFDAASQLRELIEGWTVSDFHIDDARTPPDAAPAEHLNETGGNLALYAQFLKENHPKVFGELLRKMEERVPGVSEVTTEDSGDGRVLLRFRDAAFDRGFIARAVSDGTIKMFAYLALLHDPDPHPLLCIEEPENQLYPSLLPILAEEFAGYARRKKNSAQVFVTTHSPDFLNAVPVESIYWIKKKSGFSIIERAKEDEQIVTLVEDGDKPGWLWRQGFFKEADPK